MINGFRKELRPMVRLAAPLAMAELGWMIMGFVDTVMAGRIDAASIGAGGLGSMLFFPIEVSGTGLLSGMDTLVSHAMGARDDRDCRRTLIAGLWLTLAITPFVMAALLLSVPTPGPPFRSRTRTSSRQSLFRRSQPASIGFRPTLRRASRSARWCRKSPRRRPRSRGSCSAVSPSRRRSITSRRSVSSA